MFNPSNLLKKCVFLYDMIGIFDSGAGGLSVYREIVKVLPEEKYVYYSDNAHCPYGEKSREYVIDRARRITDFLIGQGCDVIVVACNTATAAAIATLREEYPDIPFVGMEPAVKPAALGTETGVIGVLATAGTLKGSKYLKTKGRFEDDVHIVEHVGEGFVELVENGILDGPEAYATVKASLQPLLDAGADRIVLGCTHYPFLRPVVEAVAGPGVQVIDPAPAVARQTVRLLEKDCVPLDEALAGALDDGDAVGEAVAGVVILLGLEGAGGGEDAHDAAARAQGALLDRRLHPDEG